VEWAGGQAGVALPEHIGISNAGQVREELLSVINQGATTLIADMTATISCDHAGADAVTRAWQRAASSGTELRLVVTAQIVARVLSLSGLDRLVSVYPSLEAATDARMPAAVAALSSARARRAGQPPTGFAAAAPPDGNGAAPAPAGELLDALQDAVALADADGTVVAASARMDAMFGYTSGELRGLSAESLVPDGLQAAHRDHRAAYTRSPETRPMGADRGLTGLRKDGSEFPVWISLTPVTTAAGQFTLAVIRDAADARLAAGVAALASDAAAALPDRRVGGRGEEQDMIKCAGAGQQQARPRRAPCCHQAEVPPYVLERLEDLCIAERTVVSRTISCSVQPWHRRPAQVPVATGWRLRRGLERCRQGAPAGRPARQTDARPRSAGGGQHPGRGSTGSARASPGIVDIESR
jgi:anti-anti-sigma factor